MMSPKLTSNYKGYSFFTFSDEGTEPLHVHVCKTGNNTFSDKFWYQDGEWVVVEPVRVISRGDMRKVLDFLITNTEHIKEGYERHHSKRVSQVRRMRLD